MYAVYLIISKWTLNKVSTKNILTNTSMLLWDQNMYNEEKTLIDDYKNQASKHWLLTR